jgi:prepilin-type N-terminal cleavage/methylation domain-containing protein
MTLIELLVVIAIVGILSGIATVSFRRMQAESNLEASAQRLFYTIKRAKSAAQRSGIRHFVYFPGGADKHWYLYMHKASNGLASAAFSSSADTLLASDSLDATLQFGPGSVSLPILPNMANGSLFASSGFDKTSDYTSENCQDGKDYPATLASSSAYTGWRSGTKGLVVACGGPTSDLSLGALCLSSTRTSKAYAIGYNDDASLAGNGIRVRLFRYDNGWQEIQ